MNSMRNIIYLILASVATMLLGFAAHANNQFGPHQKQLIQNSAGGATKGCERNLKAESQSRLPSYEALGKPDQTVFELTGGQRLDLVFESPSVKLAGSTSHSHTLRLTPVTDDPSTPPFLTWHSLWNTIPGASAPQGDIRRFAYIFGVETAWAFDFKFPDSDSIEVPKRAKLIQTILELNEILPEAARIILGYYDPDVTGAVDGNELFVDNIASKNHPRIPYSDLFPAIAHDASYHLAAIAIPNEVWMHTSGIAAALKAFSFFYRKNLDRLDGLRSSLDVAAVSKSMMEEFTIAIDIANGDFSGGLMKGKAETILNRGLDHMTFGKSSPKQAIAILLRDALKRKFSKTPKIMTDDALNRIYRMFEPMLNDFSAVYGDADYNRRFEMSNEAFLRKVDFRISAIRKASKALAQSR